MLADGQKIYRHIDCNTLHPAGAKYNVILLSLVITTSPLTHNQARESVEH